MASAIWNGAVVAQSDNVVEVEGNLYFPMDSIKKEFFQETSTTTVCGWKGTANYFSLSKDGETAQDAAWVYRTPKAAAENIKDHVAFYKAKGIKVEP